VSEGLGVRSSADGANWVTDKSGFESAVRVGLIAYAVIHLLIAWLALSLVFGDSSGSPDQQGALMQLTQSSVGAFLLWAVAVGFVALVIWQAIEAWRAMTGRARDAGAGKAARSIGRAIIYALLAVTSARIAMGDRSSTDVDKITRDLMKLPFGQALVCLVGLAIIGLAIGLAVVGVKRKFLKRLRHSATGETGRFVVRAGQVGYLAKAVAFAIVGTLFIWAGVTFDPSKAGGLDVALRTLLDQSYGRWLLGAVAVGFGCFGVYCLAWARDVDTDA
jgi:hypothetical protein